MDTDLTLLIPAYNEEDTLPAVLPEVLAYCERHGHRLIVVDDGSRDGTAAILAEHADNPVLTVVTNKLNRGVGGALKAGLRQVKTGYVITLDADGQHRLEDVTTLYDEILSSDADMINGRRSYIGGESRYRSVGKAIIRRIAKVLMPLKVHDLNTGMKIYRTDLANRYQHLYPNSMAFHDIIILVFVSQRHLVVEHPIEVFKRQGGEAKSNTMTAVETVKEIVNIVVLFNPMKIFLPPAFLLIAGGIAWGIVSWIKQGQGLSVLAMLLMVTGLLILVLALFAEQLSSIRRSMRPHEH